MSKEVKEMETTNGFYPEIPKELIPTELFDLDEFMSENETNYSPGQPTPVDPIPSIEEAATLIAKVANINKHQQVDIADAISVATIAYHNACVAYQKGNVSVKFTTYAISAMKFAVWKLRFTVHNEEVEFNENKVTLIAPSERNKIIMRDYVSKNLALLEDRDRLVISLSFGIDCDEKTMREIADIMGISFQRVHQLHSRALLRLKTLLSKGN